MASEVVPLSSTSTEKVNPFPGQETMHVDLNHDYTEPDYTGERVVAEIDTANVVNSVVEDSWPDPENRWPEKAKHKPVLDIDFPVKVVESSTPGHHHVFIDKELPWDEYMQLLTTLADVGIIEPGYVRAAESRGYTSVRLPWIKKGDPDGGW